MAQKSLTFFIPVTPLPLPARQLVNIERNLRQRTVCAVPQPTPSKKSNLSPGCRRKPPGYWNDVQNLQHELDTYQKQHNPDDPMMMPTAKQLRSNGRRDLENAINKYRGYKAVALLLGWNIPQPSKRPAKYWDDFENLKTELMQFVREETQEAPHYEMPTQGELRKAGRADIALAIGTHGGFAVVANSLHLKRRFTQKPKHYWHDWNHVESEIREFVKDQLKKLRSEDKTKFDHLSEQFGANTPMPSRRELMEVGRGDLAEAIREHHGGFREVARKLGYVSKKKNDYYYELFYNLANEVYAFTKTAGASGLMPTTAVLYAHGRTDIVAGILKHSGMANVSQRLGLQYKLRTKGPLKEWSVFRKNLQSFMRKHGSPDLIPSSRTLLNYGRSDLYQAILHHGGTRQVGDRMGLKRNYWQDFHNVGFEVLNFIELHGTSGVMPTEQEFQLVGRSSLLLAVEKMGTSQVAQRLGLKESAQLNQRALDAMLNGLSSTKFSIFDEDGQQGRD